MSVGKKNNLPVFLVCFLLSVLFWFINAFTKNYDRTLAVPVKYVNFPKEKAIVNELPETISVDANAYGFNLLKLSSGNDTLEISGKLIRSKTTDKKTKYYIKTSSLLEKISEQLGVKAKDISPDTIIFDFDKISSKTIRISPNINYTFQPEFMLDGNIEINPKTAKITGPASVVDTLKTLATEFRDFNNLNESDSSELGLFVSNTNISVEPPTAQVKIPVGKQTESLIKIPVRVENLPKALSMIINPEKIAVNFFVSENQKGKITEDMFLAAIDYYSLQKKKTGKAKIILKKSPQYVSVKKIAPEKIDFIVKKVK